MFKLFKLFGWVVLSLLLLIGADQFLIRVPLDVPGVRPVQTFYVDFRTRLLGLIGIDGDVGSAQQSIEAVIEANQPPSTPKAKPSQRYLYVDEAGDLQFADSFELVPSRYRSIAEPLAE